MKTCTKCVMPETAESIDFSAPVCSVCKQSEVKRDIDWGHRRSVLRGEIESVVKLRRDYDCVIPFSGGKDSTFTLWHAVRELGLRCLVVRFDHGFLRQTVRSNSERAFRRLGVDALHFTPSWRIVKRLMMESLIRRGDFCWHCHTGVFAYPLQVAVKWNIPLVIWGEGDNEYASWDTKEHNRERFDKVCNLGINAEDMAGMVDCDPRELRCFQFPKETAGVRSIFLGDYHPWNPREQAALIKRELGWQGDEVEGVPPQYDYDKIECAMQGVRDYIKFLKRGFGRTSHLASIDVREGRLDRSEAVELVARYDGKRPASLDIFLEMMDMKEKEFMEIVEGHVVYPHTMPARIERANRVPEDILEWGSQRD